MGPKKARSSTVYEPKKEYIDRTKIYESEFPDFEIYAKSPSTVILLLGSDENEIVLRSLHHLDKFANKTPENVQKLYELKIVENILKHELYTHSELFIKRFALKITAEVFQYTDAKFDDEITKEIMSLTRKYYIEEEDDFMVNYSALVLLKLVDKPRLSSELQEDTMLVSEGLYKHLAGVKDPDILYNSYKLFLQLLDKGMSLDIVCVTETFPFERVLGDLSNMYPEIKKTALDSLAQLALCRNDFFVSKFCCREFFEEWFRVLDVADAKECQKSALTLCRRLMRNPSIARLFYRQYLMPFNIFWTKSDLLQEGLEIYLELSMHPEAWEYIYSTGIVNQIKDYLADIEKVSYELCVTLVKQMNHPDSFMVIMRDDTVTNFLSILKSLIKDWKTRGAAAEALMMLCKRSLDACQIAIDHNISYILCDILNTKYGEIPSEVYINILNLFNVLANDEDVQNAIMTPELAKALLFAIKNSARSTILVMNLFNTASVYCNNPVLQEQLFQDQFWNTVLKYLKSPAIMLKNAVAEFIMHTAKRQEFIDAYIDEGILEHLLVDDSALICCSNWSPAIESILSADLSLKFSVKGSLDLTDITNHNFFVSKYYWKDVKTFRNMVNEEVSPRYTLFIVNYDHRQCSDVEIIAVPKVCSDGISILSEIDCTYCRRPNDPYLPKYLDKARSLLESQGLCGEANHPKTIDIAKITDRARILAKLVSKEMCGTHPGRQKEACSSQTVSNHLNQLKYMLYCNIIPLGHVRFGGYFERALLFKTLADKTGLPCTLKRGDDGKTLWNEISVATIDKDDFCKNSSVMPTRLLRPTHIVDLMDDPGELYPIHSRQAYQYLGLM